MIAKLCVVAMCIYVASAGYAAAPIAYGGYGGYGGYGHGLAYAAPG